MVCQHRRLRLRGCRSCASMVRIRRFFRRARPCCAAGKKNDVLYLLIERYVSEYVRSSPLSSHRRHLHEVGARRRRRRRIRLLAAVLYHQERSFPKFQRLQKQLQYIIRKPEEMKKNVSNESCRSSSYLLQFWLLTNFCNSRKQQSSHQKRISKHHW